MLYQKSSKGSPIMSDLVYRWDTGHGLKELDLAYRYSQKTGNVEEVYNKAALSTKTYTVQGQPTWYWKNLVSSYYNPLGYVMGSGSAYYPDTIYPVRTWFYAGKLYVLASIASQSAIQGSAATSKYFNGYGWIYAEYTVDENKGYLNLTNSKYFLPIWGKSTEGSTTYSSMAHNPSRVFVYNNKLYNSAEDMTGSGYYNSNSGLYLFDWGSSTLDTYYNTFNGTSLNNSYFTVTRNNQISRNDPTCISFIIDGDEYTYTSAGKLYINGTSTDRNWGFSDGVIGNHSPYIDSQICPKSSNNVTQFVYLIKNQNGTTRSQWQIKVYDYNKSNGYTSNARYTGYSTRDTFDVTGTTLYPVYFLGYINYKWWFQCWNPSTGKWSYRYYTITNGLASYGYETDVNVVSDGYNNDTIKANLNATGLMTGIHDNKVVTLQTNNGYYAYLNHTSGKSDYSDLTMGFSFQYVKVHTLM